MMLLGQQAVKQRVHAVVGIADRHRAGGVAVIAAAEGDEVGCAPRSPRLSQYCTAIFIATSTATEPELGEEHPVEIAGQQRGEPPRQRQRLLVHEPAEHHMRHVCKLPLDRRPDVRMVVAVAGRPPGRDAVDQLAAVGEHDAAAVGAHHRQRRRRRLHLRVGQPDVIEPGLVPGRLPSLCDPERPADS